MRKDYKVEMKPTFWDVALVKGSYSDRVEDHLYFRANDENEVWDFLCRYLEDIFVVNEYGYYGHESKPAVILEDDREEHKNCPGKIGCICGDANNYKPKMYSVVKWRLSKKEDDRGVNWDTDYGDAWSVSMSRLNVITFQK